MDYQTVLSTPAYAFLREDPRLRNLAYLAVGGSHAYGTSGPDSDLDLRGFVVEDVDDLLLGTQVETVEHRATDTVIHGLRKLASLLMACNPNTLELFGVKPEHVLVDSDAARLLRANLQLFLSKRARTAFGGYAIQQLRRFENALAHDDYPNADKQRHIRASVEHMMATAVEQYGLTGAELVFDVDGEGDDAQVVVTVNAKRMPLRKYVAVNSGLRTLVRNYAKLNHRNRKKDEAHLRKHAMHLVRLYLMGVDLLNGDGVVTYREKDLPLLLGIRRGEVPLTEVFAMVPDLEAKLDTACAHSPLPDAPDRQAVNNLLLSIYREARP